MRIFIYTKPAHFIRGITSLELIVVLAIFGILSGITMFNYSAFSAGINLQNTAQEVALRVQQAQTESISGRYPRFTDPQQTVYPGWKPSFGVYFSAGAAKKFAYFFDQNNDNSSVPNVPRDGLMIGYPAGSSNPNNVIATPNTESCGNQNKECLDVVTIETGEHIVGICNDDITVPGHCHDNVAISFKRPFPQATILVEDGLDPAKQPQERITILVLGKNSSGLRGIVVTRLGQIYTKTFTEQDVAGMINNLSPLTTAQGIDLSFFGPAPCIGIQC
jgi:type II secretory pathway pseudopilin PulG